MKGTSTVLASGPGWLARDIVCAAGPHDRPFEERHDLVCIAAVAEGTFQYRCSQGSALLGPGALLLGNPGSGFECGHQHGVGDRCLSFHFEPECLEAIAAAVPGSRRAAFDVPRLPPLPPFLPLIAEGEVARDARDAQALEEIALRLAGAAIAALGDGIRRCSRPSGRDERRISDALRRIEENAHESLALSDLARGAGMSPFHFLRTFRELVGTTPHQFILRMRLHRAAVRIRRSDEAIANIAFDVGFNDLSTFNHRFRSVLGTTPSRYRAAGLRAN